MRLYSWTVRRLPGLSFTGKIISAGLLTVHLPLLAIVAVVVADPGLNAATIAVVAIIATLAATAVMAAVLRRLLFPVQLAGLHLADYLLHRRLPPQIQVGDDEVGRLLRDVALSCARIEAERLSTERLALQDPLTGINNRRAGAELLARLDAGDQRRPLSVALVDVDNLRDLNAAGGHAHGDNELQRVAAELTSVLGPDDWVARWGGDEFLVIGHCSGATLVAVMDQMRQTLVGTRDMADRVRIGVSVSVGVAELGTAENLAACITRADVALYTAKGRGKDSVHSAS